MGGEEIVEAGESSPKEVARDWVIQLENEREGRSLTEESNRWKAESIYMIPASVKRLQRKAYQPQMVSIGPYHHGEAQLKGAEEHKRRALLAFLKRSKKPLKSYVDALKPVEQDLKNAYPQLQPHFRKPGSDRFLKLMILDGCFILELIRLTAVAKQDVEAAYATNDPVFSDHGRLYFVPLLQRDMLMLENQIPLLLLLKLDGGVQKEGPLTKRILEFFKLWDGTRKIQEFENCSHILELYRKSMLMPKLPKSKPPCLRTGSCAEGAGPEQKQGSKDYCKKVGMMIKSVRKKIDKLINRKKKEEYAIRSATELSDAGIRFQRSEVTYLDAVKFHKGVLELPHITVDALTNSLYLNLMAFERLHVEVGNEVTSYVYFMDRLIDSAKDVSLLHRHGVIEHLLGSDHDMAKLFNSVSTDVCLDPDSQLSYVQADVCKYYRKLLPRFMAYAQQTYFANLWVTLSIVAAIFLFALTIIQTVYAILDYHK